MLILLSRSVTYTDPDRSRGMMMRIAGVKIAPIDAYPWPLTERPVEARAAIVSWCAGKPAFLTGCRSEARTTPGMEEVGSRRE